MANSILKTRCSGWIYISSIELRFLITGLTNHKVLLEWNTETEVSNYGFDEKSKALTIEKYLKGH